MRRFLFGVVIASVTAAMPAWAFGGDREIAKTVMSELQQHKSAGNLKGFDIDLKVEDGIVYLTGEVATRAQRALVLAAAADAAGSQNVVNELSVKGEQREETAVQPASTTGDAQPSAYDMQVTDAVIAKLQQSKQAGTLRGFDLDVSTVGGDVWLKGSVANQSQKNHVLEVARRVRGVSRVIDDITVVGGAVRPASTGAPTPAPVPQGSSMPIAGAPMAPRAFAPSGLASMTMDGGYVEGGYTGGPVPMQTGGVEYGAGAPRYDQPNMPSYAWPSYAAHPNYAAVTYPKQYSPSAWPYIGPFYPYPQVPLGWRKVSLEWDDGLWYLDFTSK
ncbi:MAG: BON domain-containing protein [Pirellulaceae bacterium]